MKITFWSWVVWSFLSSIVSQIPNVPTNIKLAVVVICVVGFFVTITSIVVGIRKEK